MEIRSGSRRAMLALLAPAAIVALVAACTASTTEDTGSSEAAQSTTCGNGVRDTGEQCDDSNRGPLDGCNATCGFEQIQRINSMKMLFAPDAFCTANALGSSVKGPAQGQLQDSVGASIADGTISVLLGFNNLPDLTGQNAPTLDLASFIGDPVVAGAPGGVDGRFTARLASLGANGASPASIPAKIAAGALSAGPGSLAFGLNIGGSQADLKLSGTKVKATVGAATAPTGHAASENLDPALKSFATTTGGQICGNVSAASLRAIPVPPQLAGGSVNCTAGYTTSHTMLDVFVGGCKVLFITALAATQPDQSDTTAPAVGAGAPYKLSIGSDKRVNGCKDKSGASVDLDACLKSSAYSAGFQFTTNRVAVVGTTSGVPDAGLTP